MTNPAFTIKHEQDEVIRLHQSDYVEIKKDCLTYIGRDGWQTTVADGVVSVMNQNGVVVESRIFGKVKK